MNGVKAKNILGILLLPRIIPRAKVLFASGFGYIAFLMASIYGAVRLLPPNHPYLNPANIGRFGIRHAIGEAANNLVLKRQNADQVFIFFALLAGVIILLIQLAMVIYIFVIQPAFAGSIFLTPNPRAGPVTDMSFVVLDQVFGIPRLFCTEGGQCTPFNGQLPWPFHTAFHELLRFYSLGLLIVGVVIFLYYVLIVVGETATTGHPFGQRFQNAWVPVRLVVALGLLLPINYGLNSGQYIVLYAAKFGSGFATNGWLQFNDTLQAGIGAGFNPTGERESLLAKPQAPSLMPIIQAMSIVHACAYAHWKLDPNYQGAPPPAGGFYIKPYLVKQPQDWMPNPLPRMELTPGTSYEAALNFYNNSDIVIRFGRYDPNNTNFDKEKGQVGKYCGDIRIPITYMRPRAGGASVGGADLIQEFYFNLVKSMWFTDGTLMVDLAHRYMEFAINRAPHLQCDIGCGHGSLPICAIGPLTCIDTQVTALGRQTLLGVYKPQFEAEIDWAWMVYNTNNQDIEMQVQILNRGWAGAGIWYNKIAEINGIFATSITSMPYFETYPDVMDQVRRERKKADADLSGKMQFNPNLAEGRPVTLACPANCLEIAKLMNDFFNWWNKDDPDMEKASKTVSGSVINDVIGAIFGMSGLMEMRGDNAHIHPLAQLAAVGRSLVDSAIINIGGSTITAGAGGLLRLLDSHTGPLASYASGMMMTIAMLAMTIGFILFYVLPFLPFLYFFFAFGTWIKSIFEAMVGAPLWALAHLRIDGEGLPGDSASSGYFLIFEIFVRPILTVFGLVAAVLIFTAQVRMLNVLWELVTSSLTGFEGWTETGPGAQQKVNYPGYIYKVLPQNKIDEFFYTVVYAIIVYMMATASFKLIDKIPDQILRYMGAGVSAFSDINPDPTEGLTKYAAYGGMHMAQTTTTGLRDVAAGFGGDLEKAMASLRQRAQGGNNPGQ
ncbi:MAG: hypothetical protein DYH13_08570 [Alphaproteobacteria bacterium PRO2]|nr:hypothetical protein [Alphaproteobacteria bacterium PRO2]